MDKEMVTVRYWCKNSWPYSIDENIEGATLETMEEEKELTWIDKKTGKRYLYWELGHGEYVNLLVE